MHAMQKRRRLDAIVSKGRRDMREDDEVFLKVQICVVQMAGFGESGTSRWPDDTMP